MTPGPESFARAGRPGPRRAPTAGFTLVELMVAMGIFVALGAALVTMVYAAADAWRAGERRRIVYERAQAALSMLALDLAAVYSREPVQEGVPMARFFCEQEGGGYRLSFVRTFETGPERAITFFAGSRGGQGAPYTDGFTGDPAGLKPLGGLLGVSYFLRGRELRRATLAPPAAPGRDATSARIIAPGEGERIADNVLYLGFRFWTQYTTSWDAPPPDPRSLKTKTARGPEIVWDSTRGAGIGALDPQTGRMRPFAMARGVESLAEGSDDVFPEIVEVTLVVEPDERRAVRAELVEPLSEAGSVMNVTSTAGFDDPSAGSPWLLVGNEWVRCAEKSKRSFRLSARGERGTARSSHPVGTVVRAGTTFVQRIHVSAFREDWSTEADFRAKVGSP